MGRIAKILSNYFLFSVLSSSCFFLAIIFFSPSSLAQSQRYFHPVCATEKCDEATAYAECLDELSIALMDPDFGPGPRNWRCKNEYRESGYYKVFHIINTDSGNPANLNNYQGTFHFSLDESAPLGENFGPPPCADQCFGDPINAGTGNKFEQRVEFSSQGEFPLVASWTYNSQRLPSHYSSDLFVFGRNRTHHYFRRVSFFSDPVAVPTPTAYVARPDGKSLRFSHVDSVWVADYGQTGRLTSLTDTNGISGWIYEDGQGGQETFDASGRLLELTNRAGSKQILAYDTSGRLQSVTDPQGRAISFEYNSDNLVDVLNTPDGQELQFSYAAQKDLEGVQYPGGGEIHYVYDEAEYVEPYTPEGALTGVVDESQQRFSTTLYAKSPYSSQAKAIGTFLGGGVDTYVATYEPLYGFPAPEFTVQLPNGATRDMVFSVIKHRVVPTSTTTSCAGCVTATTTYTYDAQGHPDTVSTSGVITDYDHNSRGLVVQKIEGASPGAPAYCPQGSTYYSDSYGSGCSGGSCWASAPFPGGLDASPLGYPGQYYSCPIPATQNGLRTTQTDWHASLPFPTERRVYDATNALAAQSTWTYNARGQALTAIQTDPATSTSRTTTSTYCEQTDITNGTCPLLGLVTSINGPRTDVADTTTYTYYASDDASCASSPTTCPHRKGDLWKVTDALGSITETLAYDGAGRVLSVKDANNVVTDFTYHPRGWLTARKVRGTNNASETDDQITAIEYWPTGLVKKVIQPDGAFTAYTYDAAHRLTDIADNAGNTIHYTLDNAGNRTAEATQDAGNVLRRSLSRVYNQLGQLQTAKDAYNHATGFTYDANGNNQTVTDALNRVADNDYDPLNRLVRTLQDVGGIQAETKFAYDAQDNLTKVTDPKGLDTTYTYNGFSDLTQLSSPDTGVTTYTYDSAGNRKTQTDARNITATYSYDALNRLTGIAYPTSSLDVTYTYDTVNAACIAGETFAIGRLTKMIDGSGNTEYCYDRFGHLTRKRQTTNGQVFELRYAYTKAGQLQALTYPDGAVVDYVRDGQGRTTEVGVTPSGGTRSLLLHQATYYPFGPIAGWTYGNGRTMTRTLNQNYQPLAIEDPNAGGLSLGYAFDEVGNLKTLYNADQSIAKAQYGYDALNRLTDVKDGPTGTVIDHYAYDATGNRTSFTNAGGTTHYTYPATNHRLTQVGAIARSYDNAGNTIQIGGAAKEFVYNDADRMSQVKVGGTATMNYQLSGRGEQVRKYLAANNTYTVYNEAGQWVGDYDATGQPIQQAIWLDDLPVGLLAGATTNQKLHYLQPDHLGTPRAVIDTMANTAIWRWDLEGEAFGNTVPNQDPDGNGIAFVFNMRLPGQHYDGASGLNYNYFRNYDAALGRYVESDPIGLHGGPSTYSYAYAGPLLAIDLYGLAVTCRNESAYQTDWYDSGRTRRTPLSTKSWGTWCVPLPKLGPSGGIDPSPDAEEYVRTRRFLPPQSPPIPLEVYLICSKLYWQKYIDEKQQLIQVSTARVCRDDCGEIVSQTFLRPYSGNRWIKTGDGSEFFSGDPFTINAPSWGGGAADDF